MSASSLSKLGKQDGSSLLGSAFIIGASCNLSFTLADKIYNGGIDSMRIGEEPGDVFRCSVYLSSRPVMWPLQSELQKQNAICIFITEVPANRNSTQVMQPHW